MDVSSRCHASDNILVDELGNGIGKLLRLQDLTEQCDSDGDDNSDGDEGIKELEPSGTKPVKKCLDKSATFPCSGKTSGEEDVEPDLSLQIPSAEQPIARTVSMPIVSAMKGSREKQGLSRRKLNVTWAPDVYDPIPNSQSHVVRSKPKKSRKGRDKDNNYKKNGKKGQKGNSSRGGGGKDKKQHRKLGGRSDKCYQTFANSNLVLDSVDTGDFDVGSPDHCGSSFLKKSPTQFHYSVAEAL
ncbi:hypothetical protein K2173_019543 [Erythroxylum novogranatense]|uniref:Uncharacterized protein n=1 Tax=Erythroxylum novogranatense TaxID=1862640 RepID=A0AAV8UBP3_9ROSI|nr:hypothetical protein K2173_019543 [Erythroxylum novogranatense]